MVDGFGIAGTNGRASLLDLQRLLLPPSLPAIGCTEAAVHYRAHNDAFRVGGDWYDLVDRPDDQVVAIVGDVVGHGVQQVSAMGQLRAASNALGRALPEPGEILTALDAFSADVPGAAFASAVVVMLDGSTTGRISLAGHPPPLHVKASGGWQTIDEGRGPLLGIPAVRPTGRFEYQVDDVIVVYTDGLFGNRLADDVIDEVGRLVSDRLDDPCRSLTAALVDEFGAGSQDDIVVMALRPRNHRSPEYRLQPQQSPAVVID